MISVTAAAAVRTLPFNRSYKHSSVNFKAYGCGRRPLLKADIVDEPNGKNTMGNEKEMANLFSILLLFRHLFCLLFAFWNKLLTLLAPFISWLCPFICYRFISKVSDIESAANLATDNLELDEFFAETQHGCQKLSNDQLKYLFVTFLNVDSIIACQSTCKRWQSVILTNLDEMPKKMTDQIKLNLDEGEVLLSPEYDSRTCKLAMPRPNKLPVYLRHLATRSLLFRGLIDVETRPILTVLAGFCRHLRPIEIYFLWCQFSCAQGQLALIQFLRSHSCTVSDLGFEDCLPNSVISDRVISEVGELTSLRVWSDGRRGRHCISDSTLMAISRQMNVQFEMIDLTNVMVSSNGVMALICSWMKDGANRDVTICIGNSPGLHKKDIVDECQRRNISVQDHGIRIGKHSLTLCCI